MSALTNPRPGHASTYFVPDRSNVEYRAGTSEGQHFAEDVRLMFQTLMPFLRKWARVPDDYKEIRQQAVREMQQPDFVATWNLLTAWGIRPPR